MRRPRSGSCWISRISSSCPTGSSPAPGEQTREQSATNPHSLRQENTDLRRALALFKEAIRQLTLENAALRQGATLLRLPARVRPDPDAG
ncbi:hypothetical protein JCM4814A_93550 [Streptomyces phaeofaciens JCM 4814]|uniref:Uncharacterized protein n=1 Tax=Streptomyces phaeofaciens TaxID=68254 RepID=A0A918HST4_9ACTN|nr:hypothetical protein GCM10010226_89530 [Streptomyces phaeofaciens]